MNFLKKKLKPLTSGLSSSSQAQANKKKDLEDDLYDEYVVEAPPHPSELLALGVDPGEIDINDPEKLKELYRKAKEEGKDKKVNSTLLAKQRQREEIEEKKKTREEWKYFDSITARVEQAVKESQKSLSHLKESSAIDKLTEPDYELKLTPEEEIRFNGPKRPPEKEVDLDEVVKSIAKTASEANKSKQEEDQLDEFGCPRDPRKRASIVSQTDVDTSGKSFIVDELLEDFGLDLRSTEEKRKAEAAKRKLQLKKQQEEEAERKLRLKKQQEEEAAKRAAAQLEEKSKPTFDPRVAARPRPRPKSGAEQQPAAPVEQEPDPFDTSFVAPVVAETFQVNETKVAETKHEEKQEEKPKLQQQQQQQQPAQTPKYVDPFDTSYVDL